MATLIVEEWWLSVQEHIPWLEAVIAASDRSIMSSEHPLRSKMLQLFRVQIIAGDPRWEKLRAFIVSRQRNKRTRDRHQRVIYRHFGKRQARRLTEEEIQIRAIHTIARYHTNRLAIQFGEFVILVCLLIWLAIAGFAQFQSGYQAGVEVTATAAIAQPSSGDLDLSALDMAEVQEGMTLGGFTVSSGYGDRTPPTAGASSFHNGVDLAMPKGTPQYAPARGVVNCYGDSEVQYRWTNNLAGYGEYAAEFISAQPGVPDFFFGHNDSCNSGSVNPGDVVATVGTRGVSTGYHAHIVEIVDGKERPPRIGFIEVIATGKPPLITPGFNPGGLFETEP